MRSLTSRLITLAVLASLLTSAFTRSAFGGDLLSIGDKAPKLEVGKWIQGDAVKELEKDQIYVVEFWATWCGPCIKSIPHINQLSKKYEKQVVFIGVSVNDDFSKVPSFVKKMGKDMTYRVAIDKILKQEQKKKKDDADKDKDEDDEEEQERGPGFMNTNWMDAAGQNGIPCSFIVNGDGKVAWIGHPMQMDRPLEKIVDGSWDLEKAAASFKKEQESEQLMMQFMRSVAQNDGKKAANFAQKVADLVEGTDAEGQLLNQVVWTMINPDAKRKLKDVDLDLALKLAKRAAKSSDNDGAILDTLGVVYFERGEIEEAVKTQKQAVAKVKGTQFEDDPEIGERLKKYEDALKEKKK